MNINRSDHKILSQKINQSQSNVRRIVDYDQFSTT